MGSRTAGPEIMPVPLTRRALRQAEERAAAQERAAAEQRAADERLAAERRAAEERLAAVTAPTQVRQPSGGRAAWGIPAARRSGARPVAARHVAPGTGGFGASLSGVTSGGTPSVVPRPRGRRAR